MLWPAGIKPSKCCWIIAISPTYRVATMKCRDFTMISMGHGVSEKCVSPEIVPFCWNMTINKWMELGAQEGKPSPEIGDYHVDLRVVWTWDKFAQINGMGDLTEVCVRDFSLTIKSGSLVNSSKYPLNKMIAIIFHKKVSIRKYCDSAATTSSSIILDFEDFAAFPRQLCSNSFDEANVLTRCHSCWSWEGRSVEWDVKYVNQHFRVLYYPVYWGF